MKLEDQVVSLKLAKKLYELKVKQDSLFYWYYARHDGVNDEYKVLYGTFGLMPDRYPAFTVAELGAMLPFTIKVSKYGVSDWSDNPKTWYLGGNLGYTEHGYNPHIGYHYYDYADEDGDRIHPDNDICGQDFSDPNEANARAQMLIWLIENGYVKP